MRSAEKWCEEEMNASREDKRTLVVGLGVTGLSVARILASRGDETLVIDSRARPPGLEALRQDQPQISIVLESLDVRWLEGVSQVVLSPGLGLDIPIVVEAQRLGIPIINDIELFAQAVDTPVIGVTGSNGKSTVVTLLERILSATGVRVASGGNLGPPALELLEVPAEAYLLELSSFQLETAENFRSIASAVLNVSPDHLDRHGSFERYVSLKAKLAQSADTFVFNWDDEAVREMARKHGQTIAYSVHEPLEAGYSSAEHRGERWLCRDGAPLMKVAELALQGLHNEANALAAMALAGVVTGEFLGPRSEAALDELRAFPGLPHRCQRVAEEDGVVFINDSKGTNVGATVAALRGLSGPFVLIAGGRAKDADFAPLVAAAEGRLVGAVVIGEAAAELQTALSPTASVQAAQDMREAVGSALEIARAATARPVTVLLSPACASLDMYPNYRKRCDVFVEAVKEHLG